VLLLVLLAILGKFWPGAWPWCQCGAVLAYLVVAGLLKRYSAKA
jgi:hypothetical protein